MFEVKLTLKAPRDGDVAKGAAIIQRRNGQWWRTIEILQMQSDTKDFERVVLLEDNERVVLEAESIAKRLVYDPKQMANVVVEDTVLGPDVLFVPSLEVMDAAVAPLAGPLPEGPESRVGVWREGGEQDWSRTGAKYRTY